MTANQSTAEVGGLLDRYLLSLDDGKLDEEWARSLFTADACVEFPIGRHEGIDGIAEYHRNDLAKFERTQHLNSPAVVTGLADGRASLQANVIATHTHPATGQAAAGEPPALFTIGLLVTGEARRTPDGWRLGLLSFRMIWSAGSPPPMN